MFVTSKSKINFEVCWSDGLFVCLLSRPQFRSCDSHFFSYNIVRCQNRERPNFIKIGSIFTYLPILDIFPILSKCTQTLHTLYTSLSSIV